MHNIKNPLHIIKNPLHIIKDPLPCKGLTDIFIDMARMIGFMATWTTYGSWLQGSKKGYVKNGTILPANAELEKSNKALLKRDEITIPKNLRIIVKNAILKEAADIGQKVYAIAVRSNHVHIVVESVSKRCGYSVGRFKKAATKELRKYGYNDKVWTKGLVLRSEAMLRRVAFDKRYCHSEQELGKKIKYVQRHENLDFSPLHCGGFI